MYRPDDLKWLDIAATLQGQVVRAVVTTQLARRNDEVRALRERVKLLEHVLHKGDKDYNSRLKDITTLSNEVNSLR